jgi:acyl carrier protein
MTDLADRVRKLIAELLAVEADKVIDGANFIDDLGADSLDTVELIMAFEEEFGIEIIDDQPQEIMTVGGAVKFLESTTATNIWCSSCVVGTNALFEQSAIEPSTNGVLRTESHKSFEVSQRRRIDLTWVCSFAMRRKCAIRRERVCR